MIVHDWFIHSLFAVTAIGGMMALFKVPTAKGHNKFLYSFLSFATASLFSFIFFQGSIRFDSYTMFFGLVWGIGYALLVLLQMEILRNLDTSAVFPITSTASNVITLIIGLLFFHDKITVLQFIGVFLAVFVIGFYNQAHKHITLKNGLIVGFSTIILLSTFNKFIQKSGAISVEPGNFIFWQLFFAAVASLVILSVMMRNESRQEFRISKNVIAWATTLGVLNFVGTMEIVRALSTGPFSLVYTINSFYILITSLVAWQLFGEKLTKRKVAFLLTAIIAIIFIGLK